MDEELNELESELDEALKEDEVTDDDFIEAETEFFDDETEDEPESEPEPEKKPLIADDREAEQQQALSVAQQWQAHYAAKQQELADIRAKLIEADDLDKTAEERVAIQESLAAATLDVREAKKGFEQAVAYHQQVSHPRPKATTDWINGNKRYQTDPAYRARADKLAAQLENQEGLNPSHPRFYQELDKRLMTKKPLGRPGKNGAAPVRRSSQSAQSKDSASDFDRRFMVRVGLNPADKKHLAEWKHHASDLVREAR